MPDLETEWLDGEAVIYFPLEFLEEVAKMAGALKKRQGRKLSAGEQTKLVEAGKAHRFTGKSTGRQVENLAQFKTISANPRGKGSLEVLRRDLHRFLLMLNQRRS